MKKILIAILTFSMLCINAEASHLLGSDLTYRLISTDGINKNYEITYTEYIQCENDGHNVFSEPSKNIIIKSNCGDTYYFPIQNISLNVDITPICDITESKCNNTSGLVNSVLRTVYVGYITLSECRNWEVKINTGASSDDISNTTPSAAMISIATIDISVDNSSPIYNNIPILYRNIGNFNYLHYTIEVDGDELVYEFIEPINLNLNPDSDWVVQNRNISTTTGEINMEALTLQNSIFAVRVSEFRVINGVRTLIGQTIRNMNLQVINYNGITYYSENISANFEFTEQNCTQKVQFTDISSPSNLITNWEWDFGCGHTLSSNRHLGTDNISGPDRRSIDPCTGNNYIHTTGTYQNPQHDYSHIISDCASHNKLYPAISVTLLVSNQCGGISAVKVDDLHFYGSAGTISITGGDANYCTGEIISLTAVASVSPYYNVFTWDVSSLGTIVSGQGTETIEVLITSTTGGQVSVEASNACGNPASKNIVSQACCTDNGLSGLAKFSNNFPYTLNPINKDYYGGVVANTGCGATAITATPVQGSSTIDLHGNYYYTQGNQLKVLNESTCSLNTFTFLNNITEPEYDKENNTLWMMSNGNLIEYTIPSGINAGQIITTYNLNGLTPVQGSSTINANDRYYYFIASNVAVPFSSNGPVTLATMVKIDLDNGNIHTIDVKELNAANPPQNTLTNFTSPRVVELEYAGGNRLIATVYHLVSELRPVFTEPGGGNSGENPGVLHQYAHAPVLDLDNTNNGMNNMEEVFFYRWDVMTISNNSNTVANAVITGNRSVSFDNFSSSTYDAIENKYYLTADNGNTLYTVDLNNSGFTTVQSSIGVGTKGGTRYYEIEFLNCGAASAVRKANTSSTNVDIMTSVQPNPNPNGIFTVSLIENNTTPSVDENVTIDVCDAIGRIIVRKENTGKETAIDISAYPQGVYYVKIYNASFVETKKLIYE